MSNVEEILRKIAKFNSAFAHIKRVAIVILLLLEGPMSMSTLSKILEIPINALDTHLRKLEESNIIERRKVITPLGPRTYVFLTGEGIEKIQKFISLFEKIYLETSTSQRRL